MRKELTSQGTTKSPSSSLGHRSNPKKLKPYDPSIEKSYPRPSVSHKRTSYLADVLNDPDRRDRALGGHPSPRTDEHEGRAFACPFYRRHPTFHMDCMNRKLTRIRDVKQHVHRRHSRSACAAGDSDAISAETGRELRRHRAGRTETPVAEWRNIWRILFKDEPQSRDPLLGTMVEETVQMIKEFWKNEGNQITEQFLKEKGVGANDTVQSNMSELFEVAHERFERSTLGTRSVDSSLVDLNSLVECPSLSNSVSSLNDFSETWGLEAPGLSGISNAGDQGSWMYINDAGPLPVFNQDSYQEAESGWTFVNEGEGFGCASNGVSQPGFDYSPLCYETQSTN
ncbi:unnamed protein product [Clonostachys solani]|uniref:Cyclic nucleotide-binding domain-containing protein n=1 Tax=Clonostachys solani TaxID=160281 RepID=A0A9N9ZBY5_9HYPO|nr:unnamed protein product [Clonostachys solani]